MTGPGCPNVGKQAFSTWRSRWPQPNSRRGRTGRVVEDHTGAAASLRSKASRDSDANASRSDRIHANGPGANRHRAQNPICPRAIRVFGVHPLSSALESFLALPRMAASGIFPRQRITASDLCGRHHGTPQPSRSVSLWLSGPHTVSATKIAFSLIVVPGPGWMPASPSSGPQFDRSISPRIHALSHQPIGRSVRRPPVTRTSGPTRNKAAPPMTAIARKTRPPYRA
jgi:hypothetical protein